MRIGIFETMSRPEGDAKLWFVVDELDALGAIELALICDSPLGEQADVCMSCFDESPPPGPAGKGPRSQELLARLRTLSSAGTAIEEKAI